MKKLTKLEVLEYCRRFHLRVIQTAKKEITRLDKEIIEEKIKCGLRDAKKGKVTVIKTKRGLHKFFKEL